jgi:hypothetical protein
MRLCLCCSCPREMGVLFCSLASQFVCLLALCPTRQRVILPSFCSTLSVPTGKSHFLVRLNKYTHRFKVGVHYSCQRLPHCSCWRGQELEHSAISSACVVSCWIVLCTHTNMRYRSNLNRRCTCDNVLQVLGDTGYSSGRHYFEITITKSVVSSVSSPSAVALFSKRGLLFSTLF